MLLVHSVDTLSQRLIAEHLASVQSHTAKGLQVPGSTLKMLQGDLKMISNVPKMFLQIEIWVTNGTIPSEILDDANKRVAPKHYLKSGI